MTADTLGRGKSQHTAEPATLVRVTGVALRESTVWILEGIEVETGRYVAFSCEPGYARDMDAEAATAESGPVASVDPWQMMWGTAP